MGALLSDGMQPTLLQRLFTDDRPLYAVAAAGAIGMAAFSARILMPTVALSPWGITRFALLMMVAGCLGLVLGAFFGSMLLTVVYKWVAHRNGAPFRPGDTVVILSRRYPGHVTRIYEVWAERGQVRVVLGEAERRDVTDVFSFADVCRPAR